MNKGSNTLGKEPRRREVTPTSLFSGFYRATVLVREDPNKQYRIKVNCPQVYGDISKNDLPWSYPMYPAWRSGGHGHVPPIGAPVLICFEGGNPQYPMWFAGWWGDSSSTVQMPECAHSLDNKPDNTFITTPRGTSIQLDDRSSSSNKPSNNEKILLRMPEGDYISITIEGVTQVRPNRSIDLRAPIKIEVQGGQDVEIKSNGNVSIYSKNNIYLEGNQIHLKAQDAIFIDPQNELHFKSGKAQGVSDSGKKIDTTSQQKGT
jgi:hypothetical protein